MRTTVDLNDTLLRLAKKRAAEEGIPLREFMEAALRLYLSPQPRRKYRLVWRTDKGRLMPGVNLDDRNALFDLMDGRP
jgi:hypothetical protein